MKLRSDRLKLKLILSRLLLNLKLKSTSMRRKLRKNRNLAKMTVRIS